MIGVIIALGNEAEYVIENMKVEDDYFLLGKRIFIGKFYDKDIVLCVSGVGKVNAGAAAMLLAEKFKVDKLINFGLAGGVSGSVNVADIYSVYRAVQYDFDLAAVNNTEIGVLNEFNDKYIELANDVDFGFKQATLATADRFNDDIDDYCFITQNLSADLRDMEGGAIAQIAELANIPFYCIKTVSDVAGSNTATQYLDNAQSALDELCAEYEHIFELL